MVSVIVVNWNGRRFLHACLDALVRQRYVGDVELLLVDNGSTDGSVPFVKAHFPTVTVIELQTNTGFTGGNAEGLKHARGDYVALINNDTRADEQWLAHLMAAMEADRRIGLCASKLLDEGGGTIDSAGDGITTAAVGFNRGRGQAAACYDRAGPVFGACGGAALYRRAMLDDVGFLDDEFFLYDEDVDLSFRALLAGWACRYVPDAVVYHKGKGSSGALSDVQVYYHARNLEFLWVKNVPGMLMLRYAHHKFLQEIAAGLYFCLRHGKWAVYGRAKRDALRMLPSMLRKRRLIQRRRRVSSREVQAMLTPIFQWEFVKRKFTQFVFE